MAIVMVGGHSRNVGKTSVVAGLIAATAEMQWTAVKITQFGHGVCSVNGEACDCALNEDEHAWSISEENDRSSGTDTSRFLAAGAVRSLWVRTKQGKLALAMPDLRRKIASTANLIVESNSAMRFLRPDLYFSVLDYATADFKASAREYLDLASAVVVQQASADALPAWDAALLQLLRGKPVFRINPPQYVTTEMVDFLRDRLKAPALPAS